MSNQVCSLKEINAYSSVGGYLIIDNEKGLLFTGIERALNIINSQIEDQGVRLKPYNGINSASKDMQERQLTYKQVRSLPLFNDFDYTIPDMEKGWAAIRTEGFLRCLDIAFTISKVGVGVIGACHFELDLEERLCDIQTLSVSPNYQDKGLGSILLQATIYLSAINGCERAMLIPSERGIPFYKAHGFRFIKQFDSEISDLEFSLLDLQNMSLDLFKDDPRNLDLLNKKASKNLKLQQSLTSICRQSHLFLDSAKTLSSAFNLNSSSAENELPSNHSTSSYSEKRKRSGYEDLRPEKAKMVKREESLGELPELPEIIDWDRFLSSLNKATNR